MKKKYSKTLFIATENYGKLREIEYILDNFNLNFKLLTIRDLKNYIPPKETGLTFFENALIKARHGFEFTKLPTIADDSGLEVDILNGLPGVKSKRFYDNSGDFDKNIEKLLSLLNNVPFDQRKARFKCVVVYKDESKEEFFEGVLEGYIWFEKKGEEGFGYDPVFYLSQYNKTLGEINFEEKNRISHRYIALTKLAKFLKTNLPS